RGTDAGSSSADGGDASASRVGPIAARRRASPSGAGWLHRSDVDGPREDAASQREEGETGRDTQHAGNPEGRPVVANDRAHGAGAKRRERRTQLVARANPAVDDAGVLAAERFAGQLDRGR